MYKVVSTETELQKRRNNTIREELPYEIAGEMHTVKKEIVDGEMNALEFTKPLGELITYGSVEELNGVISKMTLDADLGREEVPVLYQPIYDTITNSALPRVLEADWAVRGACVFLEHAEGEEVKFGSLEAEKGPIAKIQMFTTGFQFTEEMKLYNESYKVENYSRAVGRAHNALLNHIHLSPIIDFSYKAANKTAKVTPKDVNAPEFMTYYETISQGLADANTAKRPASILLASSADRKFIDQAMMGGHQVSGTSYPGIDGVATVIYYDGYSVKVGNTTHNYEGVPAGKAFLIRPKEGFKELVKARLTTKVGNEDVSRLLQEQVVWYTARGVFAAIEENVQKLSFK